MTRQDCAEMPVKLRVGAVILASGRSMRFGQNKLLASFGENTVLGRVINAAQGSGAQVIAAVVSDSAVKEYAQTCGVRVIENAHAERGQSYTVHLAVKAMQDMDAVLLIAGDQPLLSTDSLRALLHAFAESGKGIACLEDETHFGNPAVFSPVYYEALMNLEGDRGAKGILKGHPQDLLRVPCCLAGELADADTPQALSQLLRCAKKEE